MVLHATTVATNAVLERKGAATGLITTDGFRDVLIIGRQKRYETYDLYIDKPQPLVQRRHIAEVVERVGARRHGGDAARHGVAWIAPSTPWWRPGGRRWPCRCCTPTRSPSMSARSAIASPSVRPHLSVSISSDISPKFREYERTSTTVTNAYVRPIVDSYLRRLEGALEGAGLSQRAVRHAVERRADLARTGARLSRSASSSRVRRPGF